MKKKRKHRKKKKKIKPCFDLQRSLNVTIFAGSGIGVGDVSASSTTHSNDERPDAQNREHLVKIPKVFPREKHQELE